MKLLKVFLISLTIVFILTGCKSNGNADNNPKNSQETSTNNNETTKNDEKDDIEMNDTNNDEKVVDDLNTKYDIVSLGQKIQMSIYMNENNQLCYTVSKGNADGKFEEWIHESNFAVRIDSLDYFTSSDIKDVKYSETNREYAFLGNQSTLKDNGKTAIFTLSQGDITYYLDVRVYDDGVAFRYRFPSADLNANRKVESETTTFALTEKVNKYWAGENSDCYESEIKSYDPKQEAKNKKLTAPVLYELSDQEGYISILEGGLNSTYGGTNLIALGNHTFQISNTWAADKISRTDETKGDIITGWRLINLSDDLNGIVNNYNVFHVNDAPDTELYADTSWIEPGRSAWSWLTDYGSSLGTPDAMYTYTLNAAKLGFEYNIIDEGWTRWNNYKDAVTSIGLYGEALNVKEILWTFVTGNHNALQVKDSATTDAMIQFLKDTHMYGTKLDFWWSEEIPKTTELQIEVLKKAAKEQLLVNFHGVNKPTGFNVTYPNELTREAIRGLENIGASGNNNYKTQSSWLTKQIFTRYLAGHGDWTPACNTAMQIASLILIDSPLNVIATDPALILSNPAVEMIKSIPTVWDQTKVLSGSEVGLFAAYAKEVDNTWFAGGIASGTFGTYSLNLSEFLEEGEYAMELWYDVNAQGKKEVTRKNVTKNDKIDIVNLGEGMGFAARFTKLTLSSYGGEITSPITATPVSSNSKLKYTIDGTNPLTSSSAIDYNGEITLAGSCKLTIAIVEGDGAGTVISHKYNLIGNTEVNHVISGKEDNMTIEFSSNVEADIYYTTDGTIPTASSTKVTGPILVPKSTIFNVIAIPRNGMIYAYDTVKVVNLDTEVILGIKPDIYLGTDYKEATTGWDPDSPKVDTNLKNSGNIKIAGIEFFKGITTNSVGQFVYAVPADAKRFVGVVGVDDVVYENANDGAKGSIDCAILFDGKEVLKTETLWRDECYVIDVEVPAGAKEITIIFGDGSNGITCDNAAMGNAGWMTK